MNRCPECLETDSLYLSGDYEPYNDFEMMINFGAILELDDGARMPNFAKKVLRSIRCTNCGMQWIPAETFPDKEELAKIKKAIDDSNLEYIKKKKELYGE